MAKAILEFDLNDSDDRMHHLRCTKSTDLALFIWSLVHNTHRSIEERIESEGLSADGVSDAYRERIAELLEEYGINIDELIQ